MPRSHPPSPARPRAASPPAEPAAEPVPSGGAVDAPESPRGPVIEIDPDLLEAVLASAERIGQRQARAPAGTPEAGAGGPEASPAVSRADAASPIAEPADPGIAVLPAELVETIDLDASLEAEQAARLAAEAQAEGLRKGLQEITAEKARLEQALHVLRARLEAREADLTATHRRFGREMEAARQQASDHVLREVLPVLDVLQIAVAHAEADPATVLDGVRMVLRHFQRLLDGMGVSRIQAEPGTTFDPAVHEAILQIPHASLPPGALAEEIRSGWLVHDRLLRAARVAVVGPQHEPTASGSPDEALPPRDPAEGTVEPDPEAGR